MELLADPSREVAAEAARIRPLLGMPPVSALPGLSLLLNHWHPDVRATAALAISDLGAVATEYQAEITGLLDDYEPSVREAAHLALRKIAPEGELWYRGRGATDWLERLGATDGDDRREALLGLAVTGDTGPVDDIFGALLKELGSDDERVRYRAAWAIMDIIPRRPALIAELRAMEAHGSAAQAEMIGYIVHWAPGLNP